MNHLKTFNESNQEYALLEIKDLFQEVIDEFGLDIWDHQSGAGYFYNIGRSEIEIANSMVEVDIYYSSETISKLDEIKIYKKLEEIRNSPEIKGFESRLKSIGYKIVSVDLYSRSQRIYGYMVNICDLY